MIVSRQNELEQINILLNEFEMFIHKQNQIENFGVNNYAEDILGGLLDLIFECKLKNLRSENRNYPGLDLGDSRKGFGVQITSTSDLKKIKHTLSVIVERKGYEKYPHIYIVLLQSKKKYRKLEEVIGEIVREAFVFSKENILDFSDLYQLIAEFKDVEKIREIRKYLQEQFEEEKENEFSKIIRELDVKYPSKIPYHYLNESMGTYGREKELELLHEFIEAPGKVLFWGVIGPGGIGKSKLVHALMEKYKENAEWEMAFLTAESLTKIVTLKEWSYPKNTDPELCPLTLCYPFRAFIMASKALSTVYMPSASISPFDESLFVIEVI